MDYNTERKKMILPEYGRNIHKMVDYVKSIDDATKRNKMANIVIEIMGNMNPHLRDIADFKHKLWDHLFIMANFDLDVISPYPIPTQETISEKPKNVPYPDRKIKFKHYGRTMEKVLQSIIDYEDSEKREELIKILANHMKKNYLRWNQDSVNDEVILNDLKRITQGKLSVPEGFELIETRDLVQQKPKKKRNPKSQHKDNRKQRYTSRR